MMMIRIENLSSIIFLSLMITKEMEWASMMENFIDKGEIGLDHPARMMVHNPSTETWQGHQERVAKTL